MSVSAYSLRARHHHSRNGGSERCNNFIRTPREQHQGGVPRNDKELRYGKLPISDFISQKQTDMMAPGGIPGRLLRGEKARKQLRKRGKRERPREHSPPRIS